MPGRISPRLLRVINTSLPKVSGIMVEKNGLVSLYDDKGNVILENEDNHSIALEEALKLKGIVAVSGYFKFNEQVTIDFNPEVTLIGFNSTFDIGSLDPLIVIRSNSGKLSFKGINFIGVTEPGTTYSYVVLFDRGSNVDTFSIENCIVYGINLFGLITATDIIIKNNIHFMVDDPNAIQLYAISADTGIEINNVVIENNIFYGSNGITYVTTFDVRYKVRNVIINSNTIIGDLAYNPMAIILDRAVNRSIISNNIFHGMASAVYVPQNSDADIIIDNNIFNECGFYGYNLGCIGFGSMTGTLTNTQISITNNKFRLTQTGRYLIALPVDAIVYNNSFVVPDPSQVFNPDVYGYGVATVYIGNNIGYNTIYNSTTTLSGDGTTSDFVLGTHGIDYNIEDPGKAIVSCHPITQDAITASPVTCYLSDEDGDGVYESVRAKFTTAPVAGTNNVGLSWSVYMPRIYIPTTRPIIIPPPPVPLL